ncbi:unnamed protein product [Rotaria magnacalcarata]|uniref:Uncharacterized protein n=1 Tax=Rotaria magnacalcarata TaxID=392030 RepID=A0A819KM97_9BILA|nr:unnamed protein product [Rotaria magnacalcarata]
MPLQHSIVIPPFHEKFISGCVPIKSLQNVLHIRNYRGIISIKNNTQRPKTIPRYTPLGFISPSAEDFDMNVIPEQGCQTS